MSTLTLPPVYRGPTSPPRITVREPQQFLKSDNYQQQNHRSRTPCGCETSYFLRTSRPLLFIDVYYRPHAKYGGRSGFHRCLSFCPQVGGLPLRNMHHWSHDQRGWMSGRGGVWSQGLVSGHRAEEADPPPPLPRDGYCRSRYASYWNAFLLHNNI